MKIALVAVAGGVLGLGVFWLFTSRSSSTAAAARPSTNTITKTVYVKGATSAAPRNATASTPDTGDAIVKLAEGAAEPTLGLAAAQAARIGSGVLRTGVVNIAAPADVGAESQTSLAGSLADFAKGPGTESAAGVLDAVPGVASNVAPIGIKAAVSLVGLRGASRPQQEAILGQTTVATVQGILSGIPIVGAALAAGLGGLAQTGTGKKIVHAVGVNEEHVYEAQKAFTSGHISEAFSGGGSSHKERVKRLLAAANAPHVDAAGTQPVETAKTIAAGNAAALKLAQDIAAGKGAPGDVSSLDPNGYYAKVEAQNVANTAAVEQANAEAKAAGLEPHFTDDEIAQRNAAALADAQAYYAKNGWPGSNTIPLTPAWTE